MPKIRITIVVRKRRADGRDSGMLSQTSSDAFSELLLNVFAAIRCNIK
jgi:hypothetical protein